jgi:hypothetical protein
MEPPDEMHRPPLSRQADSSMGKGAAGRCGTCGGGGEWGIVVVGCGVPGEGIGAKSTPAAVL